MICVLKVLRGPTNRSSRYVLRENQHVEIGRSTSADISLPSDSHLSRRHVLVDSFGNGFSICDLGSVNGTYLNEERIIRRVELKNGDVIRIGMTQFRVTMLEDDANPHAEDGVLFSSSITQDLETKWGGNDGRSRSHSIPNTVLDDQTTRFAPQPVVRAETFRDDLHQDADSIQKTDDWRALKDAQTPVRIAISPDDTRNEGSEPTRFPFSVRHPFSDYFVPCEEPNLYKLAKEPDSAWGSFAGLLLLRSQKDQLLSIFNLTQIQRHETGLLDRRYRDRRLSYISKTLLAGKLEDLNSDVGLLEACIGCDGLICLGSPERIAPEELKPFANSFSYPSLFGEHMKDLRSPARHFLLEKNAWVLFEWSLHGPIGLFA
jgi:pSer/pThr/pTyr-binding forkhead associated (FHA) protein